MIACSNLKLCVFEYSITIEINFCLSFIVYHYRDCKKNFYSVIELLRDQQVMAYKVREIRKNLKS